MIPGNIFTPTPIVGNFLYLQDLPYDPLIQTVMGGSALNDAVNGRLVKPWTVFYTPDLLAPTTGLIEVQPSDGNVVFTITASDVLTVSLAFDANMAPVIAWTTPDDANLYYYDTLTSTYITRVFPGVTSCRVCVDDPLKFYTSQSDVIFGYTINGNLCYRQQRDRYNTEYIIQPMTGSLTKLGMSSINRLQFEITN